MAATLLVEIVTEELPPRAMKNLAEAFAGGISEGLRNEGFLGDKSRVTAYATPRR